jgi:malonate-semialdehyde dehydrogenase (acetylating)/methylmalonate-semialdehyde dehydrogenase
MGQAEGLIKAQNRTPCRQAMPVPILQQVASYQTGGPTKVKNYINGDFVDSTTKKWIELRNPVSKRFPAMLHIDNSRYSFFE